MDGQLILFSLLVGLCVLAAILSFGIGLVFLVSLVLRRLR